MQLGGLLHEIWVCRTLFSEEPVARVNFSIDELLWCPHDGVFVNTIWIACAFTESGVLVVERVTGSSSGNKEKSDDEAARQSPSYIPPSVTWQNTWGSFTKFQMQYYWGRGGNPVGGVVANLNGIKGGGLLVIPSSSPSPSLLQELTGSLCTSLGDRLQVMLMEIAAPGRRVPGNQL